MFLEDQVEVSAIPIGIWSGRGVSFWEGQGLSLAGGSGGGRSAVRGSRGLGAELVRVVASFDALGDEGGFH
jgi:hypothetical protein